MKTALLLTAAQLITTVALAQQTAQQPAKPQATAPQQQQTVQQPRSSDKVDLKKLEEKYWSAKDEDYAVIQNRTFSKSGKLYFSGTIGSLMNDPFAQSKPFGAALGYYFTEDFGIEASYISDSAKPSDSVYSFKSSVAGSSPNYNIPGSSYTLSLAYTPFYAKLAFMNMAIMYFDMGITAGVGQSDYYQITNATPGSPPTLDDIKTKKTATHFEIGIMQQLFLSKNFAFRLDIKNSFLNNELVPYDSTSPTAIPKSSKTQNNTYIMFGLTLFTN